MMATQDPDDFSFSPTDSVTPKMTFPAGRSYLLLNQANVTNQKRLRTLIDGEIEIKNGAVTSMVSAFAGVAALFALTAF